MKSDAINDILVVLLHWGAKEDVAAFEQIMDSKEKAEAELAKERKAHTINSNNYELQYERVEAELAEAINNANNNYRSAMGYKAERDQYQSDWLSASKTVVDYELEIDRLRELVYAVKDPMEDGGCFGSIYCKDVHGVNWFDARDALKGAKP